MDTGQRRWRIAAWTAAAACLALSAYGAGRLLGGLRPTVAATPPAARDARGDGQAATPSASGVVDPLTGVSRERYVEGVILAQKKRVMGRLRSLEMVRRVATGIRPIVDRAIEHPSLQDDLRLLAGAAGMPLPRYKEYFTAKQEADLLLESGGDPDARSVSDAVGVAQFLAGTGRQCGLKVDLARSNALSRVIEDLDRRIAWLEGRPPEWSLAVPARLLGVVPVLPAPAAEAEDASLLPASPPAGGQVGPRTGEWSRDQWLSYRRAQRRRVVLERREADHRFCPERSIRAQTRYLVRLTRRYGGIDWALQAYHGGEGGAARTMRLFAAGSAARGALASRAAAGGRILPYGDLYRALSPGGAPEAFSYVFGRSDDHRYYWWKVLMAERALALYRTDPTEFEKQWQGLHPGLSADAVYYPDPAPLQFADDAALRAAYASGALVRLPADAARLGIRAPSLAGLAPGSEALHRGLRPEAMGALLRLARLYRGSGGGKPLRAVTLVQSASYRRRWDARHPRPPLPPDVPPDPEFHTTGMTFDLAVPEDAWDRKVLEYALGRLYDSLRVSWRVEQDGAGRRYHVAVNPRFGDEMAAFCRAAAR